MNRTLVKILLGCLTFTSCALASSPTFPERNTLSRFRKGKSGGNESESDGYEKVDDGFIIYDRRILFNTSKDEIDDTLESGKIIAVTDPNIDYHLLREFRDSFFPQSGFNREEKQTYLGFYLFNFDGTDYCVNVTGTLASYNSEEDDSDTPTDAEFEIKELDREEMGERWIQSGLKLKDGLDFNNIEYEPAETNDGSKIEENETSGKVIAMGFLQNDLYLESDYNTFLCSYNIETDIIDIGTITTASNDVKRKIYDFRDVFTIDAEPKYAVENYTAMRQSDGTIIDASYLNSNTSSSVSLNGNLGLKDDGGLEVEISGGSSYSYTSNSQQITNNLKAGNTKTWKSEIVEEQFDASWKLTPAIRTVTEDETGKANFFSRVDDLNIKDSGWWFFAGHYHRIPEFRSGLYITMSEDGTFSQKIIYG